MTVRLLLAASVILLAVSLSLLGWAGLVEPPVDAEARFSAGTRLLERGAWEAAAGELRLALASPRGEVRRAAEHNLGLVFLQLALASEGEVARGWAREAVAHTQEALRLDPGFSAAAWNLEMALNRLDELRREEEMAGGVQARRLLGSLRLEEEGNLPLGLMDRLGGLTEGSWAPGEGGPWW